MSLISIHLLFFQNVDPESIQYVSPLERKKELLEELGVDIFYLVDFTKEFGALTPQEFVDQYIVDLNAKVSCSWDLTTHTARETLRIWNYYRSTLRIDSRLLQLMSKRTIVER